MTTTPESDYEFYETPLPFTGYLLDMLRRRCGGGIHNRVCYEPCVGNGAIVTAADAETSKFTGMAAAWTTNDLDPRWTAETYLDATQPDAFERYIDWTITNPPFGAAIKIADRAIRASKCGVAMYLRASIHEVLKEGPRRTWFSTHPPTGIVWLPRFGHQRSKAKGIWSTDSVASCWVIWERGATRQFIEYAPEYVLDALSAFTPEYRMKMDDLNGLIGTEKHRQAQWRARFLGVKNGGNDE